MTTRKTKKPMRAERAKARDLVQESAKSIAGMSPAERRAMIRRLNATIDNTAPTMEAAESDLLALLQAVGAEFCRRYYPTATYAHLFVSCYPAKGGSPETTAMIPVPVPSDQPGPSTPGN